MAKRISALWNVYYNWKTLRLPWRKQFLAGRDLEGNTYWEFRDVRTAGGGQAAGSGGSSAADASGPVRMRRIVQYPRGTHPGAVRVPPQWHQWLRHVREAAPSLEEQQQEAARQARMRELAARADARWVGAQPVEVPSEGHAIETPAIEESQTVAPAEAEVVTPAEARPELVPEPVTVRAAQPSSSRSAQGQPTPHQQPQRQQTPPPPPPPPRQQQPPPPEEDPWRREELARGAPGEKWQPEAWKPSPAPKR